MNLDEHNDFFLEEEENKEPNSDNGVIDFTSQQSPAAAPVKPEPVKKHRARKFFAWVIFISILVIAGIFYVRYFNPYAVEARTIGYVTEFEKRGIIFKTFEGTMATESALGDTARVYDRKFTFTVPDTGLARKIQNLTAGSPRKVTLVYEKYYGMLPWRGGATNVVTDIIEN